jgi:hypothetical protein
MSKINEPLPISLTLFEISRQLIEVNYWVNTEQDYQCALIKYQYLKEAVLKLESELTELIPPDENTLV